ncbi:PREDICTED: F-box protein SKIP27-like [Nelumbo nucifera]|uniref:F-box protein SKIP27-like n=2 Tax=Nelumbo nucifera TaxID=4432 RepID=A0A1U8BL00_NELNU|nr:PREDICTED: F-box protein SKIP27-like [Nelumbo nucifera]DAD20790.1 TPA_asm: hypothetical protein HUJ06_022253 [Nelumbo nucifera]
MKASPLSPLFRTALEKHQATESNSGKSLLEALPQDLLIRVLCSVDHDDLKELFHVSKTIREATLIAKQWHFAFRTPVKPMGLRSFGDLEDESKFDAQEAPNAPRQKRALGSRLNRKKLADISVALFRSPP